MYSSPSLSLSSTDWIYSPTEDQNRKLLILASVPFGYWYGIIHSQIHCTRCDGADVSSVEWAVGKQASQLTIDSRGASRRHQDQRHHFTLGAKLDAGGLFETASLSHQKDDRSIKNQNSCLISIMPWPWTMMPARLPYLPSLVGQWGR